MAIDYPLWYQLKNNIATILSDIATEENAEDPARNFGVYVNRWNPWIEAQQSTAFANIVVQNVVPASDRSASRRNGMDQISVNVDMYAIGKAGEVQPADEIAAMRLDLLTAQVREGLTRLDKNDFLFEEDPTYGSLIDRNINFTLTYYDQEGEQKSVQYAPARWSFDVYMPFIPQDKREYPTLDISETTVKAGDLELFATQFTYNT